MDHKMVCITAWIWLKVMTFNIQKSEDIEYIFSKFTDKFHFRFRFSFVFFLRENSGIFACFFLHPKILLNNSSMMCRLCNVEVCQSLTILKDMCCWYNQLNTCFKSLLECSYIFHCQFSKNFPNFFFILFVFC